MLITHSLYAQPGYARAYRYTVTQNGGQMSGKQWLPSEFQAAAPAALESW